MALKLAKRKPKWLQKLSSDNERLANRLKQARFDLIVKKLELEQDIDAINVKYDTDFLLGDIFSITQEEEQEAIDEMEGED